MSQPIHALHHGSGPRQVVFLHGLFGQGKNFSTVARALADELGDVTVHLLDLPNHGHSAWTVDLSYPQLADQIATWMRTHTGSVDRGRGATLVGHSMGGKVAMLVALRHPELVERLVVADISPGQSTGVSAFAPYIEAMQAIDLDRLTARSQADDALREAVPSATVRGFLLQNLRRIPGEHGPAQWRWQMNLDLLAEQLPAIGGWPDEQFTPWPGPVLWLAGQNSDYITDADRPLMRSLFPQVRLVTIKNAGHWVHAEQPAAFVAVVKAFFSPA
ncbi:alpha/beta fold hydrolase [Aestuariimicrobium sp. T2.26MG-19.2B]|uniref:alpha/beta fold hydrolase n=1 Tax=Aestuariimicrobium sp. T2.26MG-19.2B TaxID=3040679 RepID=UPI002477C774|nr:alpha/beta fold hydrolase [Aestuariimicrobium sp. T2.26MG-19.2B]CAI9410347.1 Esterase YbfF [Aestuariimicrobium sp. T2.26MG-19.2B]